MLDFDLAAFINLVISSIIGVLTGWGISRHYFKKVAPAEIIADQLRSGLQKALMPILYPHFFNKENSFIIHPEQPGPTNKDVPSVEYAVVRGNAIFSNQRVEVLIKVIDLGGDLDNPNGISIRDHKDNHLGVVAIGLGFAHFSFHTSNDAAGPQRLTVTLQDEGHHVGNRKNRNVQTLPFSVLPEIKA